MQSASLDDTKKAIDAAAKASGFRCVPVSWEDAQRTNNPFGGGLSSGGPNIADVRLYEKTGRLLYTLRSENWNERLGYVSSADVTLVTGNESGSSVQSSVSLAAYLQSAGTYGSYVGLQSPSLYAPGVDEIFSIRFQAVFLPVSDPNAVNRAFGMTVSERATTEFCTEVYSYNTRSDAEPRNMLLLATPQGTSMQQDGARAQRLYYHSVDGNGAVQRFWLEAEQSDHKVGGAQTETAEEALEAAMRGKAVAVRIGPSALGTRFNVQMLIQVPLQQQQPRLRPFANAPPTTTFGGGAFGSSRGRGGASSGFGGSRGRGGALFQAADDDDCVPESFAPSKQAFCAPAPSFSKAPVVAFGTRMASKPQVGTSNAARVSRGSLQDTYPGLASKTPQREPSMHGTITVTLYYTVVGGVPSVEDVHRCVADLDALYKSLPSDKRLAQCHEVTHNPFQSKALPHPGIPQPTLPPSTTSSVRCPNGHFLAKHTASTAPANGYNCDTCGNFYAVGEQVGYGCRHCDFDTCVKCHDLGPRCAHNAPLVPIPVASLQTTPYRQCTGCGKHTASHVGSMYGCHCAAGGKTLLCIHCYLQKVVAAKMSA